MNTILDRYVLKHYVQTFVICFVSMAGLYIVVDTLTNLDAFMESAGEHGGLFALLSRYYGLRAIAFFDKTSAILALVAAIFTVLWLRRHNELTALMAAGIPKLRVLKPVLFASALVAVIAAVGRESVLPSVRADLLRDAKHLKKSSTADMRPQRDPATGVRFDGMAIIVADRSIEKPRFFLADLQEIIAERARYVEATDAHPAGFLLEGVRNLDRFERASAPRATLKEHEKQALIQTHKNADWVPEKELFIVSSISFEQLTAGEQWQEYASMGEMLHLARDPAIEAPANLKVKIHSRLLRPFLDMTLLFIGLPIVLTKGGSNIFLSIGLCLGVIALFLITLVVCQFLGSNNWTTPARAAWLPILLFVPLAVALRKAFVS